MYNRCNEIIKTEKRFLFKANERQNMNYVTHKEEVTKCVNIIRERINLRKPVMAIILGSGLSYLTEHFSDIITINYAELPGFPVPKVEGHIGEVVIGKLNGVDVMAFRGRQHFYETNDAYPLKTLIRTVKMLGVKNLFISNAAGSLNTSINPQELMLITDHINLMGFNPLVGENDNDFGPRFPPMANAWDKELADKMRQAAKTLNIKLNEGVYLAVRGPNFETPAEIRMMQTLGGDAVGMSSVPDCLIARHCGLKVVGCSCITNMGEGLSSEELNHEHTLANAKECSENLIKLVSELVKVL